MIIALVFLFFVVPFVVLTCLAFRHLKMRKSLGSLPSPRSYPFVGHLPIIKPDVDGFVDQIMGMAQLFPNEPRLVVFWMGPIHQVMIYSAGLSEMIFTSTSSLNKGMFYDMLVPWLGYGLLTSRAEEWRPRRKLLTPTFHYDILKNFVNVFNAQSEVLIQQLRKSLDETRGVIDDVGHFISLCALDIICETSMGQSVNAQLRSDSQYVQAVNRINDIIQRRLKNPMMWFDGLFWAFGDGKEHSWALDILHSFTKKVIIERRATFSSGRSHNTRPAFLDLLLEMEANGQINQDDIQEEVDTFMFEGHDTTNTGITWALHLLGNHPNIQRRVYEEIISICGPSTDQEISLEDLARLRYTECFIKEVLRLYPSVPIIARTLDSEVKVADAVLPAGTQILVNIFLIHRDPTYWPNPEKFDPDRFLPENSRNRSPFAYVPFSAGSRNCIGQRFALMEEKVVLSWILRHFTIRSLKRRDELHHKTELILRPFGNVALELIPRY